MLKNLSSAIKKQMFKRSMLFIKSGGRMIFNIQLKEKR